MVQSPCLQALLKFDDTLTKRSHDARQPVAKKEQQYQTNKQ
jgi:hypothetical protein